LRELRIDIYYWLDFVLHDRDFLEAMQTTYSKADIEAHIAAILKIIRMWATNDKADK